MSELVVGPGVMSFRLPAPPPSINAIYQIMFALRRIELKPEVRLYKNNMKMYVPGWTVERSDKIEFSMEVVDDWYFKNGNFKKCDVQNMMKIVIDLIAEKQGWDDSQVWNFSARKKHSEQERCVNVVLRKLALPSHKENKIEPSGVGVEG